MKKSLAIFLAAYTLFLVIEHFNSKAQVPFGGLSNGGGGSASGNAGGDLSGTYPNPTVAKVNAVAYPATPSTHQTPVVTASNTVTYKTLTDCTDTGGNHLNYTQSTDTYSCGTSSSSGASSTILTGAIASLPAAGTAGRIYLANDGLWETIRDNGSSWDYFIGGSQMSCPNDGALSWVNQGSATDTALSCGMAISNAGGAANFNIHARVKAKLAATFTLTVGFISNQFNNGNATGLFGVIVADGTTAGMGNQAVMSYNFSGTAQVVNNSKFTGYQTFNSNYFATLGLPNSSRVIYMRVQETASNRIWSFCAASCFGASPSGWMTATTTGNTDFLTTSQYGVFVQDNNVSGTVATAFFVDMSETTP